MRVVFIQDKHRDDDPEWEIWASRPDGKTNPEELIATARGSCFAMALSNDLAEGGTPPERLEISAVCTFDVDNVRVASVDLDIRAGCRA